MGGLTLGPRTPASPLSSPSPPSTPLPDTLHPRWPASLVHATGWVRERPWLALVALGVLLAAQVAVVAVARWRRQRLAGHARLVTITPPPEVDPAGTGVFWANLSELLTPATWRRWVYGTAHVVMQYHWCGRRLSIGCWVPDTLPATLVVAAVRAAWPGAAAQIGDAAAPLPCGVPAEGGALGPVLPAWYSLATEHDTDPMRPLLQAAAHLAATEQACVQILARPATPRQVARLRRGATALRTGRPATGSLDPARWMRAALDLVSTGPVGPPRAGSGTRAAGIDPIRDRDARAAVDKTLYPQWEVAIRYGVTTTAARQLSQAAGGKPSPRAGAGSRPQAPQVRARLWTLTHGIASAYGVYTGRNRLRRLRLRHPAAVLATRSLRRGFLAGAPELAVLAGLPTDLAVPGLDRARAKSMPAPVAVASGGRGTKTLGRAQVGGHCVALSVADARHHVHIIGATGSGKSVTQVNMILDDIHAGRGVALIDTKGDTATDLLARLPARYADRLVLIDPDQPRGATLNPLSGRDDDLVVDNIVSIFGRIFQRFWGPRIDDVLRVACLTLMRKANATLTLVPSLLQDKQFRAPFVADLDDPEGLRGFWDWYETSPMPLRAQVIAPVLARLRSFLLRDFVRNTIGVAHSSFDMSTVLDGGILIARLPKGQIGEETAKLMGSFVLASVWQAATARAAIPEDQRRDATCYIDECHNVLNLAGSVADMLAEARGYRLSFVLAHQDLAQFPRETVLALSANARNKLFFNVSPEDAHQLARHTLPELDEHDLSHLDAFHAAARLVVGSRETAAFTLITRPPRGEVGEVTALRQAVARPGTDTPTGIEQVAKRRTRTR
ncbi:MAG TPA: type VI secretion protein [Planosporangium sp.]|nr:type VI secretion protein [Planosporangium sp.]